VRHVDPESFAVPLEIARKLGLEGAAIDIAVHTAERFEVLQAIEDFMRSEIAGVPNLVALGEMMVYGFVQKTMCVGKQADLQTSS
jgi:predicted DsbA family dithiol-disulfide isomerase